LAVKYSDRLFRQASYRLRLPGLVAYPSDRDPLRQFIGRGSPIPFASQQDWDDWVLTQIADMTHPSDNINRHYMALQQIAWRR
jgi:hypothetical protein